MCACIEAVGGMPVGTNGKATLLLSGGIDSPVAGLHALPSAAWRSSAVHYPFLSLYQRARQGKGDFAGQAAIRRICCGVKLLYRALYRDRSCKSMKNARKNMRTLVMRRFMMRIAANASPQQEGAKALITGEKPWVRWPAKRMDAL